MIKKFESYKGKEIYDIDKHINLFKKLWDKKSGGDRWYSKDPHWTTRNLYDTDFKGVHLTYHSNLLHYWHRDKDDNDRKDGVNMDFLKWLKDNGYKYYWYSDVPYSWSGILIIPPEYTEFNNDLNRFGL